MTAFSFFDNIYYINLASRTDRDLATRYELSRIGINAQRVEAFSGENKFLAFNRSQFKALSEAKGDKVLIFEDDIIFRNASAIIDAQVALATKELPEDWDMFFLGANVIGNDNTNWETPEPYSPHLNKIVNNWTTHAVGYSRKCIDFILSDFNPDQWPPIFDEYLRTNVLPVKNCFVMNPMIADQRAGLSDIWQRHVEYGFFEQGNKRMKI